MDKITIEEILKLMADIEAKEPVYENETLDEMMAAGGDITDLSMITGMPDLRDVGSVRTKYGRLRVMYSPHIPDPDSVYLLRWRPTDTGTYPLWRDDIT